MDAVVERLPDGELPLREFLKPIADRLADPGTKEIVVNQAGLVGIETDRWEWIEVPEFTYDRLDQISILAAYLAGEEFYQDKPLLRANLATGIRYTAVRHPATIGRDVIYITTRVLGRGQRGVFDPDFAKMTRNTNTPERLQRKRARRAELVELYHARQWPEFFDLGAKAHLNFVACGITGSGKTSFLQRLLNATPLHERVITIQNAEEYGPTGHRNRVDLRFGQSGVSALDCSLISLRMRPDRVILQEVSGDEAYGLYRILMGGHGGGMTTLHCEMGVQYTLAALETMIRAAPGGNTVPNLAADLRRLIDVVVYCDRDLDTDDFDLPYVWFRDAELTPEELEDA